MRKLRYPGFRSVLRLLLIVFIAKDFTTVLACDRSDLTLDSLVQVGQEYDIYLTLSVGGGVLGQNLGAGGNTGDIGFTFYSCFDTVNISYFTPSITSDSTGGTLVGGNVGPQPQAPFMSQGFIFYGWDGVTLFSCINSTSQCGGVHTQVNQLRFRTDVVPDSICVFGVEGSSNPLAGCFPGPEMTVVLPNPNPCGPDTTPPVITCSGNQTINDCTLPDLRNLVSATDDIDPNPSIDQFPAPGSPFPGVPPATVTFVATDAAGNSDSCSISVTVNDIVPPQLSCPPHQTLTFQSGQCGSSAFWQPPFAFDNCSPVTLSSSASSGDFFGPGTSAVTYTATDSSGNISTCLFFITVNGFPLDLAVRSDTLVGGVHIACAGDSTGIAVGEGFDGCPPYQFLWSNGSTNDTAFGLPAGWISLTITDGLGNTLTDSVLLTEPPPFSSNLPPIPDVCGQDSIGFQVAVAGGSAIMREYCIRPLGSAIETCYSESTPGMIEVGPLPAGTYVGIARDTLGCELLDTFTIVSLPPPIPNLPISVTECSGDPVVLDAGNPGSSYLWSTGDITQMVSTFQPGTISVIVTAANGCTSEDSSTIQFASSPVSAFSSAPGNGNQTYDFTELTSGDVDSLHWEFGDDSTSSLPNPGHTYNNPGIFTVCLTAIGPCGADTSCQTLNVVSVENGFPSTELRIIPNPARDRLRVSWGRPAWEEARVRIWDLTGKLLLETQVEVGGTEQEIDLASFASGMYLLKLQIGAFVVHKQVMISR